MCVCVQEFDNRAGCLSDQYDSYGNEVCVCSKDTSSKDTSSKGGAGCLSDQYDSYGNEVCMPHMGHVNDTYGTY